MRLSRPISRSKQKALAMGEARMAAMANSEMPSCGQMAKNCFVKANPSASAQTAKRHGDFRGKRAALRDDLPLFPGPLISGCARILILVQQR